MKLFTRTRLIEERKRRQWSQQEVADLLDTTQHNVSRWERGSTTPGLYFRTKLCNLFGKDANTLGLFAETEEDHAKDLPLISATLPDVYDPALPLSPHGIPGLIGRQALVDQLIQVLCDCGQNTVALAGLPGVGKTALAVALAHHPHVQQHFQDGILWVGLGQDPQVLENMHRWGALLGISTTEVGQLTSLGTWARRLYQQIGRRRMLLILDDAWDLGDALTFRLGGAHCGYLLTTRLPTLARAFAREQAFQVPELNEDESVALLDHIVHSEHQQISIPQMRALAHAVGGLPLALILMGGYLYVQAQSGQPRRLQRALEELQQNIRVRLDLNRPQAPGEHTTSLPMRTGLSLQMAIDISAHRLPEQVQVALQALSVFPPKPYSFSEEAALTVCGLGIDTLDFLIDSGLLGNHQPGRYHLHQTIADYARLQRTDLEVETRLVAFFVEFICEYRHEHELLEQDLHNISAAFDYAHERQMFPALIRGVLAFMPFVSTMRLYDLADKLLTSAQHAAHALADQESLARTWVHQGEMAELISNLAQAEQSYLTGLAISREIRHAQLTGQLLILVGSVIVDQGDYVRAEAYLQEGLALVSTLGNQEQRSIALKNLGEIADNLGDLQKAQRLYHQSLAITRQQGNGKLASALLQNLGALAAHQGDDEQAEVYFQEGLVYAGGLKDFQRQSAILMNQGLLACYRQHYTKALALSLESLRLARKIGNRIRISSVLQNLGIIEGCLGNETQAEAYLQESLALAQAMGHLWLICETSGEWGKLYLRQQNLNAAWETFQKMREDAISIGAQILQAQALFGLAQVEDRREHNQEALQYACESQALFQSLGNQQANHIAQWLAERISLRKA